MKKHELIFLICLFIAAAIGISHNYSKEIGNYLELKNMDFEYIGQGKIKIRDFPGEPKLNQIQGKFKITDITDEVIMDMNLPNEAVPHGAQKRQQIGGWFPFDDIKMPENFNNINPWGQIFIADGEEYPENARLHIEDLALICYKNSTKSWEIINEPSKLYGSFYKENYSDQSEQKAEIEFTKNGIIVNVDSSSRGRCFHFWTPPVKIEDPEDILYVTVYCDAWVTGENIENKFVFNAGADYKKLDSQGNGNDIKEIVGGRFKILKNKKRRVYATNLAYDKYFTICSQKIIDDLY